MAIGSAISATQALTALTATSVVSSVAGSAAGLVSASAGAAAQESQGRLEEQYMDNEARRIEEEGRKFKQRQKLNVMASGVDLSGSPLLMLNDIEREYRTEANYVRTQGTVKRMVRNQAAANLRSGGYMNVLQGVSDIGGTLMYNSYMQNQLAKVGKATPNAVSRTALMNVGLPGQLS